MVADQLIEVKERIARAAIGAGRAPGDVTLVVVTKARTVPQIEELLMAGHVDLGENKAQELVAKAADLPQEVNWHFVGNLQRNKVSKVRPLVGLLHSLDSVRLAEAWAGESSPPALLQVNVGGEAQKHGVAPGAVAAVTLEALNAGIDLRGLMTLPPLVGNPEEVRPYFAALKTIRDRLVTRWPTIRELSMGMTDDYEVAVSEGATIVRIGRAIFGPRPLR